MTDEDDGFALADKLLHDGEQSLDLDVGQGGGGLVKDQQLGPVVEGLEDLGALLFADGDLVMSLSSWTSRPYFPKAPRSPFCGPRGR